MPAMPRLEPAHSPSADDPPMPRGPFVAAWALFCTLLGLVAVLQALQDGSAAPWRPLLWEATSCLVGTPIIVALWRLTPRWDHLIARPARWFLHAAGVVPLLAPCFVVAVFLVRAAVHALLGETYAVPARWVETLLYEGVKFSLFYLLLAAAMFGVRAYAVMCRERWRSERLGRLAQQAQLTQLAQQLQPHFLFNALGLIAETVHTNAALADTLLSRLAQLLRATTDLVRRPETTLAEELHLVDAYAALMAERFAGRVRWEVDMDPALAACRVPTLLVQPLVENAFRHGVERVTGVATLRVRASRADGLLQIEVENDLGVLDPSAGQGTGLSTLRDRLQVQHGAAARLEVAPRPGGGVRAVVVLPCVC